MCAQGGDDKPKVTPAKGWSQDWTPCLAPESAVSRSPDSARVYGVAPVCTVQLPWLQVGLVGCEGGLRSTYSWRADRFGEQSQPQWESRIDSDFTTCGSGRGEGCNPGCLPGGVRDPVNQGKRNRLMRWGKEGHGCQTSKTSFVVWMWSHEWREQGGAWDVRALVMSV